MTAKTEPAVIFDLGGARAKIMVVEVMPDGGFSQWHWRKWQLIVPQNRKSFK